MSTLSNVDTQQDCTESRGIGVESFTFPDVRHSQTGVSVEYAPDPTKKQNWYVFRVTYNHEIQVTDALIQDGVYAYLATKRVDSFKDEQVVTKTIPLINLVFAYLTEQEAKDYTRGEKKIPHLTFYYNHFSTNNGQRNPPLTVRDDAMYNFILATQSQNKHIRVLTPADIHNHIGKEVRVIHGEFEGVRGRVARIAGQQRVVIDILDGMLIATAYVPTAFLELQ